MDSDSFQTLLNWVSQHPYWAGFFVFLMAAVESLAVIGMLVPGVIFMLAVGALIGVGALSFWSAMAWAIAGAVVGDGVSFWLGHHYHERLREMWPLSRYPQLISRGEAYFNKHGGKSIVLGRFVGPIRAIVPAVAGMLGMSPLRFYLMNFLSAILWAPAMLIPGVLFGASLQLASAVAGRLVVVILGLIVLLWLAVWVVHHLVMVMQPRAGRGLTRLVQWSGKHRLFGPLVAAVIDPLKPEWRGLAVWAVLLVLAVAVFGNVLGAVVREAGALPMDSSTLHLLQGLRTPWGDRLMVLWSELGDPAVLWPFAAVVAGWFAVRRQWPTLIHWVVGVAFAGLVPVLFELALQLPRPISSLYSGIAASAFPSWHAAMSLVCFGLLAAIVVRGLPPAWRWLPYAIATVIVLSIAFSRVYLGAQWLSDVIGGLALGLIWTALLGIAYRRHAGPEFATLPLIALAVVTLGIALTLHAKAQHAIDTERYALRYDERTLLASDWRDNGWQQLSAYRIDLAGRYDQPMTVQYAGNIVLLRDALLAHDWRVAPEVDGTGIMHWLTPDPVWKDLAVLPHLHDGRQEVLLMERDTDTLDVRLVLRLWSADVVLKETEEPVLVGNVSYVRLTRPGMGFAVPRTEKDFVAPLEVLRGHLTRGFDITVRSAIPSRRKGVPRNVTLIGVQHLPGAAAMSLDCPSQWPDQDTAPQQSPAPAAP